MPGRILIAECSCGFEGGAKVGVTDMDDKFQQRDLVAAFDPDKGALVSIDKTEAASKNLTIYPDPYIYNQHELSQEGNLTEVRKGDRSKFTCPKCGKHTLHFFRIGD